MRILLLMVAVLAAFLAARSDTLAAENTISTLSTYASDASLAIDAAGNPVVAYRDSLDTRLKILHCDDASCLGGGESLVSLDLQPGQWPSLTLDGAGNPVMSYYSTFYDRLKFLHCNDPNCVAPESLQTPDPGSFLLEYQTSLALDASGNAVIAYSPPYEVRVLHCNDLSCAGNNESITAHGSLVGGPSLALDGAGNPVVAYYAFAGGNPASGTLRVMHCNDPDCAGNDESVMTPDAGPGVTPSLALDAAGGPVIAYYTGATTRDLKVLHCDDVNCAGQNESITTPDAAGDVGGDPALMLVGGNPLVAYRDGTHGYLKLLACNDPDCAGADDPIRPLDPAGDSGENSSLTTDALLHTAIAYDAGLDLHLIRCGETTCVESVGGLAGAPAVGGRPGDGRAGPLGLGALVAGALTLAGAWRLVRRRRA